MTPSGTILPSAPGTWKTAARPRRVELHHVARDHDHLAHRRVGRVARLDDEAHLRALGAADLVHDLAKLHADDLDGLLPVLGDLDDLVVRLELPAEVGRASGDDLLDDAGVLLE